MTSRRNASIARSCRCSRSSSKSFAERAGGSLSGLLGRDASMQFTSIESVKAADLQAALPMPASVAVVRFKPLAGFAFVCVDPSLLLALLDGFFGGSGRSATDAQAAVAPAAQRFLALLLRSFRRRPGCRVGAGVADRARTREAGDQSAAAAARRAAGVAHRRPIHGGIRRVQRPNRLAAAREHAGARSARRSRPDGGKPPVRAHEPWAPVLSTALQDAELETRAILAQAKISLRELVRLAPGDIIPIDTPQHVTLLAGEVPLYRGRFGVSQGRNALKILPGGSCMSVSDPKTAAVARAQFNDLGPNAAAAAGQEMNLNLILDVAVTLALEVGRARMSVRELLQLAPGAIVELDRLAGEPLDVLVNGVRVARGEVVVVNEKFGIRLTDVVSETVRMEQAR